MGFLSAVRAMAGRFAARFGSPAGRDPAERETMLRALRAERLARAGARPGWVPPNRAARRRLMRLLGLRVTDKQARRLAKGSVWG